MTSGPSLAQQVREDWHTHDRRTLHPGFHALAVHRLGTWAASQPPPLRQLAGALYKVLNNLLVRNVYGIEVFASTRIGRRVLVAHHMGVVLGAASIGDDVLVRQHVTLGSSVDGGPGPRIGDRVRLGAGAIVLGGITIGDGAVIGPGAVVLKDVPAGATAFASPARILPAGVPNAPSQTG